MLRTLLSSLRFRLLLLVLLAVVPALALLCMAAFEQRATAGIHAREEVQRLAEVIAVNDQRILDGVRGYLTVLAHDPSLAEGRFGPHERVFGEVLRQSPWIGALAATDPAGNVLFSVPPTTRPLNLADSPAFREALTRRRFAVAGYQINRLTSEPSVLAACPVEDATNAIAAMLCAELRLDPLNEKVAEVMGRLPPGSSVVKVAEDGTLLTQWPDWNPESAPQSGVLYRRAFLQAQGRMEARGPDGVVRYYGFARLSTPADPKQIAVLVGIPQRQVFLDPNRVLRRNLLGYGLVALLSLAAAWLTADLFVLRGMRTLLRATDRLRAGDLQARTGPPYGHSEIDRFSRAFDEMAEALEWREAARQQTQESLRASEAELQAILSSMTDLILVFDADGCVRRIPPTNTRLLYWPREEVLGRGLHEVLPPTQADRFQEAIRRTHEARQPVTIEYGLPTNGTETWFAATLSPMLEDMVVAVVRDVTPQKREQARQVAFIAGLHAVVKAADELFTCPDLDTLYRRAVELARARLGMCRCAIFLECDGGYEGTYAIEATGWAGTHDTRRLAADRAPWRREIEGLTPEGRRWVLLDRPAADAAESEGLFPGGAWLAVTPIQSHFAQSRIGIFMNGPADGTPVDEVKQEVLTIFASLLGNIIERKRAEEALRRSEVYFRSLIENTSDIILIENADGTVRYVSPAVQRILGYAPEEIVGQSLQEYVHLEDLPRLRALSARLALEPERTDIENARVRNRDGSWRLLEVMGKNLFDNPAVAGLVVTARDVTERHQLEERLHLSLKMEAIGKLAGGVAHDFNNLLTAVIGYSDLVLERMAPADPLRSEILEIRKAGERATALTRQLLAFSRRQVLQPKAVRINSILVDMDKMLRRLIGEDLDLETVLAADLGTVRVDPNQIEQVVLNLAVNARDAMPKGGHITIETSNVDLDESCARRHSDIPSGPYVLLAVSDTGSGMDPETLSHIFEPFFTTKEIGKGTGLGLSTIYGIIKQSGGHVWVYSEVGRGTTLKIYLPRVDEAVAPVKSNALRLRPTDGNESILVVEDETEVRKLVREVLEMKGYRVWDFGNAAEAIALCEKHEEALDLLVTDVIMPGMSGRELARRLMILRPEMSVLYMSGYTDDAIVHHGVLDKGTAFIQKPFSPEALARRVRDLLDDPARKIKG